MIRHKAVYRGGSGEIVEKKSRFIANIKSVETVEEAQVYIEEMKKKYWDARHNCSAFSVGTEQVTTRCSDDGEPSGTVSWLMEPFWYCRLFFCLYSFRSISQED